MSPWTKAPYSAEVYVLGFWSRVLLPGGFYPGGITANWGFRPQISPSHGGPGPQSNTGLLGTTRVFLPNRMSFQSNGFSGVQVQECDKHTYRRNHAGGHGNSCMRYYRFQRCRLKYRTIHHFILRHSFTRSRRK